jgi:hypothetical protein
MTEAEWLVAADMRPTLAYLQQVASERKWRLFAVAFTRHQWALLYDDRLRQAVRIGEAFADGMATQDELNQAYADAYKTYSEAPRRKWADRDSWLVGVRAVADAVGCAADARNYVIFLQDPASIDGSRWKDFHVVTCSDIFGNPFRPVTFFPQWRTDTAVSLARQMYESRDFSAMPILADALQDAGCEDEQILSHCRGDVSHVRGCWVVDLVLGKA